MQIEPISETGLKLLQELTLSDADATE